jgi:SAM-dependent methyltransferase
MRETTQPGPRPSSRSVLEHYQVLEPGEGDTWNPLHSDFELAYRLSLSYVLTQCLRLCQLPIADLRVLDVGCGNGRSTRAYIDLGLRPDQLVGIDLRSDAIGLARRLNPAIEFRDCDVTALSERDTFTWIQAATVHSSIETHQSRRELVEAMTRLVAPGGYLFYFDLWRANGFAGYDVIDVDRLHSGLEIVWSTSVRAHRARPRLQNRLTVIRNGRSLPEVVRHVARPRTRLAQMRKPSHRAHLVRKPR